MNKGLGISPEPFVVQLDRVLPINIVVASLWVSSGMCPSKLMDPNAAVCPHNVPGNIWHGPRFPGEMNFLTDGRAPPIGALLFL